MDKIHEHCKIGAVQNVVLPSKMSNSSCIKAGIFFVHRTNLRGRGKAKKKHFRQFEQEIVPCMTHL